MRNYRFKGFTLAEVLITLGIIGVVAALTIPTLINNYQEKVTVTKVKKMYSTLSNAYALYVMDNGESETYPENAAGAIEAFNIFKPYLKISQDCGTFGQGCIYEGRYKLKSGELNNNYSESNVYYKAVLSDGSTIWIRGGGGGHLDTIGSYSSPIFYDVNGKSGPNQWGYDLFGFRIYGETLEPSGMPGKDESFESDCASPNADNWVSGWGCTAWVVYKGNLDFLKCDGLTWDDTGCK